MKRLFVLGALALALLGAAPGGAVAARPAWLTVDAGLVQPPTLALPELPPARRQHHQAEKHGFVDRLQRWEISLLPDGRVVEREIRVRHFLTADGVRDGASMVFWVRSLTDRLAIETAYLERSDGSRRPLDPALIQIAAHDRNDLFSDSTRVVLPLPAVAVDSSVVVVTRRTRELRGWPLPWSEILYTQLPYPVERWEVKLAWTEADRAAVHHTNDPRLHCQVGTRALTCRRDEVAAIDSDPDVASLTDVVPQLVLSRGETWQQLIDAEKTLLFPAPKSAQPASAVAALALAARRLTDGQSRARAKLDRLFRFVADEVRYVGLEHGRGAVEARPPQVTLERRFGDCKDKVALLLALAAAADLPGYPVLVATTQRDPSKLIAASWKYFDHVVACFDLEDPKNPVCMDPTDPNLGPGELSFAVRDAVALPLHDGGTPRRLRPPWDYGWRVEVTAENRLDCDGAFSETVKRTYEGSAGGAVRALLRPRSESERQRWLAENFAEVRSDKVKPSFKLSGIDQPNQPVAIESTASFPAQSGQEGWIEWRDSDVWLTRFIGSFRSQNRVFPLGFRGIHFQSTTNFVLCPKLRPRFTGPTLRLQSPYGTLQREARSSANRVSVSTLLTMPPTTVPAPELPRFNRFIDRVVGQADHWLSVTRSAQP